MYFKITYLCTINKALEIMTRIELINKVDTAIESVVNGFASQYIKFYDENDNQWTVRVSDHSANPSRCDQYTISLVIPVEKSEDTRKYFNNFSSIPNVHFLSEEGSFIEQFYDVEEMLEYYLD